MLIDRRTVLAGAAALAATPATSVCFEPSAANPGYGLSWWLLRPGLVPPAPCSGIDADPDKLSRLPDVRMAAGAGDQRLYLMRERDMVVVRQADGILNAMRGVRSGWSDPDFLALVLS